MLELLKLVKCEFLKLKRKKFIPIGVIFSLLFPIALTFIVKGQFVSGEYLSQKDAFDSLFDMVIVYGMQFLLPCMLGILAAVIFFEERDNDTFKNLKTIPITSTQLVISKIILMLICSIIFCLLSCIASGICGLIFFELNDFGYKLLISAEMGILMGIGILPLVVVVVYFSKTYIFSILLCVFWTSLNTLITAMYDVLPKFVLWILPIPLSMFWSSKELLERGMVLDLSEFQKLNLLPSTLETFAILGVIGIISIFLIDYIYRKRSE